jgi:hypothetical protein
MRVQYQMDGITLKNKALCIGDLIRYYGESKYKTLDTLDKIRQNKGLSSKLLNAIRRHANMPGLTVDNLMNAIETASEYNVFTFLINGEDMTKIVDENRDVKLEIYMHPLYFSTRAALTMYTPGIGKRRTLDEQEKKEKDSWTHWFEKELNTYYPIMDIKKKILEE